MKIQQMFALLAATSLAVLFQTPDSSAGRRPPSPNVVLVLVDDMSENLYPYMTEVQRLADEGVTFANYFNATPWCCPSRATIQAGKYPHNTQVKSNGGVQGGFGQFMAHDMDTSIGVQMQDAGYRTGMLGKYLNGYRAEGSTAPGEQYPANFVPPGWDSWFAGLGYQEFQWSMVRDEAGDSQVARTMTSTGSRPERYLTDVLSAHAQAFLNDRSKKPFFLMVAPFAPHNNATELDPEGSQVIFPPAPRDRADSRTRPRTWGAPEFAGGDCGPVACRDVPWPDTLYPASFNQVQDEPLDWMPTAPILSSRLDTEGRRNHIQRIQMLQSVNDMLRDIRLTLEATRQADNTYIMFTSDNGLHIGEHAIFGGKTTAYDHDTKTPLVMLTPDSSAAGGAPVALVQNTDLLPTILSIAGAPIPADVDGVSLLPLVEDPSLPWRSSVLLELTNDGDADGRAYFNPDTTPTGGEDEFKAPTYNAIRTADYLYIDYSAMDSVPPAVGEAEYYELATDHDQMVDLYSTLPAQRRQALNDQLLAQTQCVGAQCAELQGLATRPAA